MAQLLQEKHKTIKPSKITFGDLKTGKNCRQGIYFLFKGYMYFFWKHLILFLSMKLEVFYHMYEEN